MPRNIDLAKALAQRLKLRRLQLGWSQKDLAERYGTTQSHIHTIETCQTYPTTMTLAGIADALGMELTLAEKVRREDMV